LPPPSTLRSRQASVAWIALQRARVLGFEFNDQTRLARRAGRDLLHDAVDSRHSRAADPDDIATISRIVNIDGLRASPRRTTRLASTRSAGGVRSSSKSPPISAGSSGGIGLSPAISSAPNPFPAPHAEQRVKGQRSCLRW
jgi:hypothetical protein